MDRKGLARKAISEALRVRARVGLGLTDPASAIDIAEKLGVQVWFRQLSSLEGMLIRAPHPLILLSSLRPNGRMNFTCAHELAHFWFRHDGHVDVVDDGPILREDTDDEFQANMFAAYLLMPKTTVQFAFAQRKEKVETALPSTFFAISNWLGVGYSTLVHHLRYNLILISEHQARALLRVSPKSIVTQLAGVRQPGTTAFMVDHAWRARAVDLEVGDVIVLNMAVRISGICIRTEEHTGKHPMVLGVRPGTGHLDDGAGWATYIRVRRSQFEGRSIFRHLEENEDE
jgi:Zn-dependent peptidase ImmA (M78 family)